MSDKPIDPIAETVAAQAIEARRSPFMDGSGGWPMPNMLAGMTFADIGSSGLRQYGGWVREEFLPQLVGQQGARMYREMVDNSPTIGSLLFSIQQSMRKVEWRVTPANDTPAAQELADFADSLRFDMSHTWEDFVTEALSMLAYGYAPHELVYKARLGPNPPIVGGKPMPASRFSDGRIGLRRMPLRGQDTVIKWFLSDSGEVKGMTQQPYVGTLIDIPIEKMLLFRPTIHKGNPEGRSVLRNSVRPYVFIKRLEEQEAIMVERFGGLPVMYVPSALLEAAQSGDANAQAMVSSYKRILTNVRIDEQMGVMLPSDTFQGPNGPSSVRMYEFRLVTPEGRASAGLNTDVIINRYKLDIWVTCLADFIQLGHAVRGTNNLATVKVDMFYQAIEGWLNALAAVLNRHLLPRIWRLNNLPVDLMPEYVPDMAQRVDLDSLGAFLASMATAGAQLFPDPDLENFLRDAAGMPDISDEAAYGATAGGQNADVLKQMLLASTARRVKRLRGR